MSIDRISEIWPDWEVTEQLGEGSYGKVYKAIHKESMITTYSAIKVISIPQSPSEIDSLRGDGFNDQDAKTYFNDVVQDCVSEIKLMESLKGSSNIVSVEDFHVLEKVDSVGWEIFIRMELLTPFNKYISEKNPDESEIAAIGVDICSALERCGKKNIIHRDIKPENIFVSDMGDFKLGDFGIAKELDKTTGAMSTKGTYNYMAPEIYNNQPYDATVDTYSLGIVLYKLLNNNRLPFLDPYTKDITYQDQVNAVNRRVKGELLPPPVNASKQMQSIIMTACNPDPKKRFNSPTALKKALEYVASGKAVDLDATKDGRKAVNRDDSFVIPDSVDAQPGKKSKAGKIVAIIIAVLLAFCIGVVAVVGGVVWAISSWLKPAEDHSNTGGREQSQITVSNEIILNNYINNNIETAKDDLESLGFKVVIKETYHNAAKGTVVSQSPNWGSNVKKGSTVELTVSLGEKLAYGQKIVVTAAAGSSNGALTLYEADSSNNYVQVMSCVATVGAQGISSAYGEGKNRSPMGIWKVGAVMSVNGMNTAMPQAVDRNLVIVDDPTSPYYNIITKKSVIPSGTSYEAVGDLIASGKYNAMIFIEHNGNGSTKGTPYMGSAITICGKNGPLTPTGGCVDITASSMVTLLSRLDPNQNPHIEFKVG